MSVTSVHATSWTSVKWAINRGGAWTAWQIFSASLGSGLYRTATEGYNLVYREDGFVGQKHSALFMHSLPSLRLTWGFGNCYKGRFLLAWDRDEVVRGSAGSGAAKPQNISS